MREALIVIWETSDRVCGKRLRPLMPILVEAMGIPPPRTAWSESLATLSW
jgi:hypothetical protein